ncbi:MAG: phosphate ABC transporter substrate-binding protein PstS [Flavisolibacter sp.]
MYSKQPLKHLVIAAMTVAAFSFSACNGGGGSDKQASGDDNTLIGAGSTFVYPLFSKQFAEYNKVGGLRVNYQSIGSGGGIQQLMHKTVDFGDSDAPLNEEQDKQMGAPVLHIPMCSGAVVISYNLANLKDTLKLTPEVIANIFLGKIKVWNDPQIASANAGVQLPSTPIVVAHRSDGSGTTNIFTTYLSKVNTQWNTSPGKGSSINWPIGLGGKGNEGVAGLVKQTPGAIGYVELAYAIQNKMAFAKVQNKAGNFITPSVESTKAASNIQLPEDSKVSLTNTDAADGYPISGFTWALIYKEQKYDDRSQDRATKLLKLLWWNIHDGQKFCEGLNYAPLSPAAVTVAEKILNSATYDGKPILQ